MASIVSLILEFTNASNRIILYFIIVSIEAAKLIIVENIWHFAYAAIGRAWRAIANFVRINLKIWRKKGN